MQLCTIIQKGVKHNEKADSNAVRRHEPDIAESDYCGDCCRRIYCSELIGGEEHHFDNTYTAYLTDEKLGDVEIKYIDGAEDYMVHAELKKAGDTVLTLVCPTGIEPK